MDTFDLFVGGRMEGLTILGGTVSEVLGVYDPAQSDCAIQTSEFSTFSYNFYDEAGAPYIVAADNSVMAHASVSVSQGGPNGLVMIMVDGTGRGCIAAYGDGAGNIYLAHNGGSGWVKLGTGQAYRPWSFNTLGTVDIQVKIDSGGNHNATLLCNAIVVQSSDFTDTTLTGAGLMGVVCGLSAQGGASNWSQLYARLNASTVNALVKTCRPTGAGTHADWTGGYTEVNAPITNDANFNQSLTAGQKQSYPMGNVTVPAGYNITSAWNWIRARNNGGVPSNVESIIISGATEQDSGDLTGIGLGFSGVFERFDTDPHTSAAWTQAGWNAPVECGYESAT